MTDDEGTRSSQLESTELTSPAPGFVYQPGKRFWNQQDKQFCARIADSNRSKWQAVYTCKNIINISISTIGICSTSKYYYHPRTLYHIDVILRGRMLNIPGLPMVWSLTQIRRVCGKVQERPGLALSAFQPLHPLQHAINWTLVSLPLWRAKCKNLAFHLSLLVQTPQSAMYKYRVVVRIARVSSKSRGCLQLHICNVCIPNLTKDTPWNSARLYFQNRVFHNIKIYFLTSKKMQIKTHHQTL